MIVIGTFLVSVPDRQLIRQIYNEDLIARHWIWRERKQYSF